MRDVATRQRRGRLGALALMTAHKRARVADTQLAAVLAFVAGGINAGGFLIFGQYTSHMTGYMSSVPDNLVIGALEAVGVALAAIACFVLGAAFSAVLINWARRRMRTSQFVLPVLAEALLLVVFGLFGSVLPGALGLVCFVMGLQNATITKISGARLRTTHVTGMVTDIGIELGKAAYRNRKPDLPPVRADTQKLKILLLTVGAFVLGGLAGALGFAAAGSVAALPFAVLLLFIALPALLRRRRRKSAGPQAARNR